MGKSLRMKKWKFMLYLALACMMLAALPAHAEGEIKVVIEGEEVQFDKAPVVENGTTLVPFRVLFERLGLAVNWVQETKTIVGKGEGIAIELQLDRKEAVINGETVEMAAAPRVIDGSAYVPLRLVGEATGRLVNWDGAARTITIGAAPSAPAEPAEDFDFEGFYRSFLAAGNAEDLEAIRSMLHPESPLLEDEENWVAMLESFRLYDVVMELEDFEVLEENESYALIYSIEKLTNTNDLFYVDRRMKQLIDLVKDETGAWKVYMTLVTDMEYLVSEDRLTADADIDADVEKAIFDLLVAHLEAAEAEDPEAMMNTIDPASPAASETERTMKLVFAMVDAEYDLEYANVIQVTDTEAFVYTIQTMKNVDDSRSGRSKQVQHLRKQADGSWKYYATYTLSTELVE